MKQSRPTSVVYIITHLELGGAQKVCLTLFKHMHQDQFSTHLITGTQGILAQQLINAEHVHFLPTLQRQVGILSLWNELRTFWTLVQKLRTIKKIGPVTIVHTHSTKAGILGRWAAFFARIPIRIHTVHGFSFHTHQSWWLWIFNYIPELLTSFITTHYICVSTADSSKGSQIFPGFKRNHSLIRAAVEESFYFPALRAQSFPQHQTPFVFGSISCFKPQKNLFDLLQAFAYVHSHNPNARLEIIGDGQLRPAIESWIAHYNLERAVALHGWQEDVKPYMITWHAFVLSSLWEGLPCAVVEARLLKLPVLSYTTGGIGDVIEHGNNGLLCPQKGWMDLAHAMLTISDSAVLHNRLQTYHDAWIDQFSHTHMIAQHRKLYAQLCCAYQ